ncbi:MAG TPA: HD domain-containing protein [Stellaceae bacterium]|nr:HD domain-containing protein [Stellaceae bacterium]
MILSRRYDDALIYASGLHREQMRKGTQIPYVSHLLAVSSLVIEHGGDEDQAIAGLLDDAAEDQGGEATLREIRSRFGEEVAKIVSDCTDAWTEPKPPWRARKEAYIAILPRKDKRSLLVSLADKTHNARAILMDYRLLGDELWSRFNGGRDGTIWYYTELAAIFKMAVPGLLSRELDDTVTAFMREPA